MTALLLNPGWWRRRWRARLAAPESGFTVTEVVVAMALVFLVLTGTLATFSAGVRNLVSGRQRSGAVALARSVIEEARSSRYGQVGHDLAGDATLADDPLVAGSPKTFEGEQLVGVPDAVHPEHREQVTNDTGTFTRDVYVTWVDQGAADPFKRITVIVTWANEQYDPAAVSNQVRLSSFLFAAGVPPDPLVSGSADVDGGTVETTGLLDGVDLKRAVVYNPSAAGVLDSLFVREASGQARSASGLLEVNTGSVSGCEVDATGKLAQCNGIVAGSATDSDASTVLPEHDADGPRSDTSHVATAASSLTLSLGANDTVHSTSTARSCLVCFSPAIGDDDRLAHHWSEGTGPDTATVSYQAGSVSGSVVEMTGASKATATLDQDQVAGTHALSSRARLQMPGVDVVTVDGGPTGFTAAVRIGAVDVTVDAAAGPASAAPSISGAAVAVDVYDTTGGTPGYRTITVTPGAEKEESASSSFAVGDATVSLTTTVLSGGASTAQETDTDGTITYAEATLTNWLRITVEVLITTTTSTLADATVEFDYGRLNARAQWDSV